MKGTVEHRNSYLKFWVGGRKEAKRLNFCRRNVTLWKMVKLLTVFLIEKLFSFKQGKIEGTESSNPLVLLCLQDHRVCLFI